MLATACNRFEQLPLRRSLCSISLLAELHELVVIVKHVAQCRNNLKCIRTSLLSDLLVQLKSRKQHAFL